MNLETPIKSQKDIMNERLKKMGMEEVKDRPEGEVEEAKPLRSSKDIAMEKADRIMAESKAKESDAEKIKALQEKLGVDLSQSVEKKQEEAGSFSEKVETKEPGKEIGELMKNCQSIEELYAVLKNEKDGITNTYDNVSKFSADEMIERLEEVRQSSLKDPQRLKQEMENPDFLKYAQHMGLKENFLNLLDKEIESSKKETVAGENNEKTEAVEKPRGVIDENVQAEALKNYVRHEKHGTAESYEPKDAVVMGAMADFIDHLDAEKKKNSIASTMKKFINFLRKKKEEKPAEAKEEMTESAVMEAMRDFTNEISGKARKETGKSKEALKVDQSMDRAREAGAAEKIEGMKERLKAAESMDELIQALDGIDVIKNNDGVEYKALDQQAFIDKLFKSGDERFLRYITRAPGSGIDSSGVRKNVERVFRKIEQQKINAFKEKIRSNKKEEFKQAA
jgi:hypothetical protein